MSPSWNDRLLVAIRPDKVILLRLSRGLRPALMAKAIIPCLPDGQAPKWKAALSAFAQILQDKKWRKTRTEVVLSQHFIRAAVMPANLMLKNKEEEEAYALHCLAQASGDALGDWQLRFADVRPGLPKLVCAMESTLLEALDLTVRETGGKLASIRPHFVAAHDGRRRQLSKHHAWLAVMEHDRCCLLHLNNGVVQDMTNRRIFSSAETELPAFLEQERLLAQIDRVPDQIFLAAPEHLRIAFPEDSAWKATTLPVRYCAGLSPHTDAAYGMALEAGA